MYSTYLLLTHIIRRAAQMNIYSIIFFDRLVLITHISSDYKKIWSLKQYAVVTTSLYYRPRVFFLKKNHQIMTLSITIPPHRITQSHQTPPPLLQLKCVTNTRNLYISYYNIVFQKLKTSLSILAYASLPSRSNSDFWGVGC